MSATKNKAIDKLNEPAKPTAARKKQIRKAVTAVVKKETNPVEKIELLADTITSSPRLIKENFQKEERERQAVEVAPEPTIVVIPEPVKEPEPVEPIEQSTEPIPTIKQKAAALWAKCKWAVYALGIGLLAALIYDWIRIAQINKQLRQTQQVESKVADEKGNLGKTEANLSKMQQIKRSAETLNATIDSMQQITAREAEEHQRVYDLAKKYKLQNYELQTLIRNADDSTLRAYGAKPSN